MARLSSPASGRPVSVDLDGRSIEAREGEPLAVSLVDAGQLLLSRSVKYHRPRGAFCMAASCGNCLVRVNGVPNVQACRVAVHDGMRVERQNAYPSARVDVFGFIDWFFPRGMHHNTILAGVPVAEQVMARVARQLAGLGTLPDLPARPLAEAQSLSVPVLIIGAGPAGLAASEVLTDAGVTHVVIERDRVAGGRLNAGPVEADAPAPVLPPSHTLWTSAQAFGVFEDAQGRFVAVEHQSIEGDRLVRIYARALLLAVGGHARIIPFENNELPGIFAGRAATRMIRRHGVLPGREVALVGRGDELAGVHAALREAGITPVVTLDLGVPGAPGPTPSVGLELGALLAEPTRALGRAKIRGLNYRTPDGIERRVSCDALVLALPPSPSYELASQMGAQVDFDPAQETYRVRAAEAGSTGVSGLWVAGELLGPVSAREAAESGRRAARAILTEEAAR